MTATLLFEKLHGKTEFLSKDAIITFAEQYYSHKIQELTHSKQLNDTFYQEVRSEIPRKEIPY
jgi:hypothetical protein